MAIIGVVRSCCARRFALLGGFDGLRGVGASGGAALETARAVSPKAGGPFSALDTVVGVDNVTDRAINDWCGLPRLGRTLRFPAPHPLTDGRPGHSGATYTRQ